MKLRPTYSVYYNAFALVLLFNLLVLLPFGIVPLYKAHIRRMATIDLVRSQISEVNASLRDIRDMRYLQEDVAPYVTQLNYVIPTDTSHAFLLPELDFVSAKYGYVLRYARVSDISLPADSSLNTVPCGILRVQFSLQGPFVNLPDLVSFLEASSRSWVLDSFTVSFLDKFPNKEVIDMDWRLFILEVSN